MVPNHLFSSNASNLKLLTDEFLTHLMAQWIDMGAQKSRTERMLVRDHPNLGWFEATDLADGTQRVKKA